MCYAGVQPKGRIATTMPKTMSLRIDDEQARALSAVALANETTVSEIVRDAIAERVEQLRNDEDFQAKLRKAIDESREALELLAK
jgi:predicted transcriptional regulator